MEEKIQPAEYIEMTYEQKIDVMTEAPHKLDLPDEASYIAQYLAQYRPVNPPEPCIDNETSADIQDTLSTVCLLDLKLISRVMSMLGYRLTFQGVSHPLWAMRLKDGIEQS